MARRPAEIATRLFEHLLKPLVLGGAVTPTRPLGSELSEAIAALPEALSAGQLSEIEFARVQRVRMLMPLDHCTAVTQDDWRLVACLHDLLQAAHPSLSLTRQQKLLESIRTRLHAIAPVKNAHEALMRHSLFARTLEIGRVDTKVQYWVGSAVYLGAPVPARLTAWPELRRVQTQVTTVHLADLVAGQRGPETLNLLLRATPLTDLANCARLAPVFELHPENCAMLANPHTRKLSLRALHRLPADAVARAFVRASAANPALASVANEILTDFREQAESRALPQKLYSLPERG